MQENQNRLAIPAAIVVAGLLIAGSIFVTRTGGTRNGVDVAGVADVAKDINPRAVTAEDHILGNPDADVIMIEYSDTECPYCKSFHATLHQIMDEYGKGGKVAWVYRHFPIDQLHSKARNEAEATECVKELGGEEKFWTYLDKIFTETSSNDSLDPKRLPELALEVGVDQAAFSKCLANRTYKDKVERDIKDAFAAGARGTPHTVIVTKDGEKYPVEGGQPISVVKAVIDSLLAGTKPAVQ
jgi:protein-disulfide isomerase